VRAAASVLSLKNSDLIRVNFDLPLCVDHFTGIQAGGSMKPPGSKVLGLLWGKQQGLEVRFVQARFLKNH
jgi:hypothetical protein